MKELRARLQHVSGDHADALESLRETAARFRDRRGMFVAELIRRFRMAELRAGAAPGREAAGV